jgi:hypothetical protein
MCSKIYFTIDRFTTSTVVVGEITTLKHKVGNNTMEATTSITKTLLTSTESTEVFSSFGNYILV